MLTPDQLCKNGSEHGHQAAFFAYCTIAHKFGFAVADSWVKGLFRATSMPFENGNALPALEWIHAIPNGGSRGSDARSRAIGGAMLKAEGVKPGIPDIFLPFPNWAYCGLYIELKKPDLKPVRAGSKRGCSDEQLAFADWCVKFNYAHTVCYGWQEAVNALKSYLALDSRKVF